MDFLQVALYTLGLVVFLVLSQDLHIFPGALISKVTFFSQRKKKPPPQVESQFINSKDGTKLEVWKYKSEETTKLSDYVAIIFHGNGGPVENFIFVQMWLAQLGIPSYNFDYRGFGRSAGWPNEKGIYLDGEAIWEYVKQQEKVASHKVIIIGISVGSGPAARIAAMYSPKLLLLSSAFTDLKSTVRAQPIIGLLSPFLWYTFPTIDYVRSLKETDLLIAHGMQDNIVPPTHSAKLEEAYSGNGRVRRLTSDSTGHNMAFYDLKDDLKSVLMEWL